MRLNICGQERQQEKKRKREREYRLARDLGISTVTSFEALMLDLHRGHIRTER
jgi:hypothetical protein